MAGQRPVAGERATDEELGRLARKQWELFRQVREGSLPVLKVLTALQDVIDGQFASQAFTALVDYDDPSHRQIDRDQYYFVADDLKPEHFPIRHRGQAEVTFEYVTFDHDPTTQEVLDEIERRGDLRVPDFAETRTFHQAHPDERKEAPVISLCGSIVRRRGRHGVACVLADVRGLSLIWHWLDFRWARHYRFLAVRK